MREMRENMYCAEISTFTVVVFWLENVFHLFWYFVKSPSDQLCSLFFLFFRFLFRLFFETFICFTQVLHQLNYCESKLMLLDLFVSCDPILGVYQINCFIVLKSLFHILEYFVFSMDVALHGRGHHLSCQ